MAEMKVTLTVDSEPVRSLLREAADAMSAATRDIGTLLAQIDALQEATGEALEAEDAALVSHIRQAWSGFQAPQEQMEPLGYISSYGLEKLQTRRHYCVSVSHQAEKEYVIPIFREAPAPQDQKQGDDE